MMKRRMFHMLLVALLVFSILLGTGCRSQADTETNQTHELAMAPESAVPDFAKDAPIHAQEAYRFAVANPNVLQAIPCYCGCVQGGHRDNLDCYVAEFRPDGTVEEFDNHAVACEICVDITQDTMELLEQGRSLREIRFYVDINYEQYGPPTETEPVQ